MSKSGYLKQQCVDESGLYEWVRKFFLLNYPDHVLEIRNAATDENPALISLTGAKSAKEWSFSSSIAGYGFDIIWTSGKIWSFLADNQTECQNWVQSLNETIQNLVSETKQQAPPIPLNTTNYREPAYPATTPNVMNQTVVAPLTGTEIFSSGSSSALPQTIDFARTQPSRKDEKGIPNDKGISATNPYVAQQQLPPKIAQQIPRRPAQPQNQPFGSNVSEILGLDNHSTHGSALGSDSSPDSAKLTENSDVPQYHDGSQSNGEGAGSIPGTLFQSTMDTPAKTSSGTGLVADHRGDFRDVRFDGRSDSFIENAALAKEYETLRQRYQQLSKLFVSTKQELDDNQNVHEALLAQQTSRGNDFERELYLARQTITQLKTTIRELENKQLRSVAESQSSHEAELRSVNEQHRRELQCLKDELLAERKRFTALVQHETELRNRAEGQEITLKLQLQSLQETVTRQTSELIQRSEQQANESSGWSKEREGMIQRYEQQLKSLQDESIAMQLQASSQLTTKIAEMNDQFRVSLQEMEHNCSQRIIKEMDGQLMRELSTMQKKCSRDVEKVRSEERRIAAAEVEKLKTLYAERERQTADDLLQLEQLHADRVRQLETKNKQLQSQHKESETMIQKLRQVGESLEDTAKRNADRYNKIVAGHAAQADVIRKQLEQAHREVQQSQSREASYREKMTSALEEVRILRAEMIEAQRQLSAGSAQAFQWRQAASDSDINNATTVSALQIARDEVSMLEHELASSQQEKFELKARLEHLEGIVYGSGPKRREALRSSTATPVDVRKGMDMPTTGGSSKGPLSVKKLVFSSSQSTGAPSSINSKQRPRSASTSGRGRLTQSMANSTQIGQVPSARKCSRSPQRCWAAATVIDRENSEFNRCESTSGSVVVDQMSTNAFSDRPSGQSFAQSFASF